MCKITEALQKPFPAEDIEWRVGSTNQDKTQGIALAYITNRAIMARLDETFGAFGWKNEYKEWKGTSQLCGISVKHEGEWITKWDGADDSATEAVKGGLSDAMKRAGYQWGIGRYLYNLDNIWVPIKPQGRSFVLATVPKLPAWALPGGYEQKISQKNAEHDELDNWTPPPDENITALAEESKQNEKSARSSQTNGSTISEGQTKMLYAKWKYSVHKDLPKPDVLELISAELAKTVNDFKEISKADINKVIKWFETAA